MKKQELIRTLNRVLDSSLAGQYGITATVDTSVFKAKRVDVDFFDEIADESIATLTIVDSVDNKAFKYAAFSRFNEDRFDIKLDNMLWYWADYNDLDYGHLFAFEDNLACAIIKFCEFLVSELN